MIQRIEFAEAAQEFLQAYNRMASGGKGEKGEPKKAAIVVEKKIIVEKKEETKMSAADMEKVKPILKRLMRGCLARRRFKHSLLGKQQEVIAKFGL